MFKKKSNKQGISLQDVINKSDNLLSEHKERPWVIQWMTFFVLFLFVVSIVTIVEFYS
jgi:hypothetical protein